MENILYLASQSKGRKKLLDLAQIPYKIIAHKSDECGIDTSSTFHDYVLGIAQHKMTHVTLPNPETIEASSIFVLTADTLMRTAQTKQILGKPTDKAHAKQMLALLCREEAELATACCLDRKQNVDGTWRTANAHHWVTQAKLTFCVTPDMLETYFAQLPHAMYACGAGIIEDFGLNFLQEVHGSFTAITGLPLFELRENLKQIGFFESP